MPRAVVMIHGLPGSHRDFRWLAPLLEPHVRVIRLDMPGFGGTAQTSAKLSRLAEHVLRRLDQLELERVVLLGHSFGGSQALLAAARDSSRVRGLALLASVGLRPHRGLRPLRSKLPWLVRGLRTPVLAPALVRLAHAAMQRAGFPRRTPLSEVQRTVDVIGSVQFGPLRNAVAAVHVPTFVAWADDDPLVEPAIAEELGEVLTEGPRLRFDSGGHNIQKTRACEVGQVLAPWVASVLGDA